METSTMSNTISEQKIYQEEPQISSENFNPSSSKYEVVVVGGNGVGKSALIVQLNQSVFIESDNQNELNEEKSSSEQNTLNEEENSSEENSSEQNTLNEEENSMNPKMIGKMETDGVNKLKIKKFTDVSHFNSTQLLQFISDQPIDEMDYSTLRDFAHTCKSISRVILNVISRETTPEHVAFSILSGEMDILERYSKTGEYGWSLYKKELSILGLGEPHILQWFITRFKEEGDIDALRNLKGLGSSLPLNVEIVRIIDEIDVDPNPNYEMPPIDTFTVVSFFNSLLV